MIIADKMSVNAIVAYPEMTIKEASSLMKKSNIHRMPVLDEDKHLVGVISEKDIMLAAPSPASTLSPYEINYLLDKLTVGKIMSRNPVTITKDTPIEEATSIMIEKNISCLPVMENNMLIGIVTKTDLFKILLELFGAKHRGIRVECLVEDAPGVAAKLSQMFSDNGLNIFSLGTLDGRQPGTKILTFKLENATQQQVEKILSPLVKEITDIREI